MSVSSPDTKDLIVATEQFVQKELSNNDASHDWNHIARVRALAVSLAREEGIKEGSEELQMVELAALLHDIADWKYSGSETRGVEMAKQFLTSQAVPEARIQRVAALIEGVGFKSELGRIEAAAAAAKAGVASTSLPAVDPLLGYVQDGDRLDAIGAIGIARCFTYGGAKNRPLYEEKQLTNGYSTHMTHEEYKNKGGSGDGIGHFYEKLLKLKELMKTGAGKKRAEHRHQFMVQFLDQFRDEVLGRA